MPGYGRLCMQEPAIVNVAKAKEVQRRREAVTKEREEREKEMKRELERKEQIAREHAKRRERERQIKAKGRLGQLSGIINQKQDPLIPTKEVKDNLEQGSSDYPIVATLSGHENMDKSEIAAIFNDTFNSGVNKEIVGMEFINDNRVKADFVSNNALENWKRRVNDTTMKLVSSSDPNKFITLVGIQWGNQNDKFSKLPFENMAIFHVSRTGKLTQAEISKAVGNFINVPNRPKTVVKLEFLNTGARFSVIRLTFATSASLAEMVDKCMSDKKNSGKLQSVDTEYTANQVFFFKTQKN